MQVNIGLTEWAAISQKMATQQPKPYWKYYEHT